MGICHTSNQPDECCTRPFFRRAQEQGCSLDMLSGSKTASDPISIPLKEVSQISGAKPISLWGGLEPGVQPPEAWGEPVLTCVTWMLASQKPCQVALTNCWSGVLQITWALNIKVTDCSVTRILFSGITGCHTWPTSAPHCRGQSYPSAEDSLSQHGGFWEYNSRYY